MARQEKGTENRLTVVDVMTHRNGDTIVEAIATGPSINYPYIHQRRFRFRLEGEQKVDFGWLIGLIDERRVVLQWHPDEPGLYVKLRCHAKELIPFSA